MRICSGVGCGRAVQDNQKFCDECSPAPEKSDGIRSHTRAEKPDRERYAALYGCPRWKKHIQPKALRRDPFCRRCGNRSEIVDHRVPAHEAIRQAQLSGLWPLDKYAGFFLMSNLQGLCRRCHKIKTDEDAAHVGEWPDVVARERCQPKRIRVF